MERLACEDRAERMLGILMDATLPEAARSRCFLLSWACSAAMKGGLLEERVEFEDCVFCSILGVYCIPHDGELSRWLMQHLYIGMQFV